MLNTIVLWIGWITVAVCFAAGWLLFVCTIGDWIIKGSELHNLFVQFAAHRMHEKRKVPAQDNGSVM